MAAWSQVKDASLLEETAQWAWSEAPGSIHALPSQWHGHSAECSGAHGLGHPGILEEAGAIGLWGQKEEKRKAQGQPLLPPPQQSALQRMLATRGRKLRKEMQISSRVHT